MKGVILFSNKKEFISPEDTEDEINKPMVEKILNYDYDDTIMQNYPNQGDYTLLYCYQFKGGRRNSYIKNGATRGDWFFYCHRNEKGEFTLFGCTKEVIIVDEQNDNIRVMLVFRDDCCINKKLELVDLKTGSREYKKSALWRLCHSYKDNRMFGIYSTEFDDDFIEVKNGICTNVNILNDPMI
jgi:hypothetical protein